jgi:hypothetical protein
LVNRCTNPHCCIEFKVLSSGDLYAYERRSAETEFYWLCSACASRYDLYPDRSGRVSVKPRGAVHHDLSPRPDGNLRLVTRSTRSLPRLQTMPSSEPAAPFGVRGDSFFPDFQGWGMMHH